MMVLTHDQVIAKVESRLIAAMIQGDLETIGQLCHKDIVYTNEIGKTFCGVANLQLLNPGILTFQSISILGSTLHFFDAVAVVNSHERRTGTYMGLKFSEDYHLTRVWKFARGWKLIATVSMHA